MTAPRSSVTVRPEPTSRNGGRGEGETGSRSASHSLQVVGLGWPRTGTGTLCDALVLLGLGPCHHLRVMLRAEATGPSRGGNIAPAQAALANEAPGDLWAPWEAAAAEVSNKTRRAELVLEALRGYTSAADVPAAAFYEELLHAHHVGLLPSSMRFVLPERSAEQWYASAESTVLSGWTRQGSMSQGARSPHAQRMARLVWVRLFGRERLELPAESSTAIGAYARHQQEVRDRVAPESLLLWSPEEGWPGLCGPLGLPEPATPFPWRNRRGSSTKELLAERVADVGVEPLPYLRLAAMLLNCFLLVCALAWCLCRPGTSCAAPSGGRSTEGQHHSDAQKKAT